MLTRRVNDLGIKSCGQRVSLSMTMEGQKGESIVIKVKDYCAVL